MINKEEVRYNTQSLLSTWFYKYEKIDNIRLILKNGNTEKIVPCAMDNVAEKLSNVLCDNSENYTTVKLIGVIDNKEKTIGELDII